MQPAVYSYTRFSDPRQGAGQSVERQTDLAARWAASRGLVLDASLSMHDEGLSAYHQKHIKAGALGVFLAAVEAGRIAPGSYLLVEQLDRLSRAAAHKAQSQLAAIIDAGIIVVTTNDGKEYSLESLRANPYDLVMSVVLMIRAHEESETKSKRVLASIRSLCERWQAGTYRGLVRNGKDPAWLERVGDQWQIIPERVAAVQAGLDLYRQGYGAMPIVRELERAGLALTERGAAALQIYRLVRQHALAGDKELEVDGETFILSGYYPALLSRVEWNELQAMVEDRAKNRTHSSPPGDFVHVLTGMGVLQCGYCGSALVGQNLGHRPRLADGRIKDYNRRMFCVANKNAEGCPVAGSRSIAPVERAVMSYCSDMMNLQALYGLDRTSVPRAKIANARAAIAEIDAKLERLTDAMLAVGKGQAPATFIKRARDLEAKKEQEQAALAAAERALASTARTASTSNDAKWRALATGVEQHDEDARRKARQLVQETFERIVVYHKGVRPDETPKRAMDMMLLAKGGVARMLRINADGSWLVSEDVDSVIDEPAVSQPPAAPARKPARRPKAITA